MRQRCTLALLALVVPLYASASRAAEPTAQADSPPSAEQAAQTNEVAKDPHGIKGISPFWEAIAAGDAAVVGGDVEAAITHYEQALKAEGKNPMGHYRMAQARLIQGDQQQAKSSLEAAVRYGKEDAAVTAKALFVLANLAEQQGRFDDARTGWKVYLDHVKAHLEIQAATATANDRLKRLETRDQMIRDYSAVKDRIKKREAELTQKAMSGQ